MKAPGSTLLANVLTQRAMSARALVRRAARVNTRNRLTRTRTRLLFGVLVLAALVVVPAGIAMADPGDGAANTWVSPFKTKDSHGIPMSSYTLSIDEGGVTNPKNQIASFFLTSGWDMYRIYVGVALWIFDYALQFQMLDLLKGPATAVATALEQTIGQLGVIPVMTLMAFGICAIWIQTGKSAAGFSGLCIALLMGAMLTTAAVKPMDTLVGEDGLILGARDLGVGLSSQIVTGGESQSTDGKELQSNSSAKLVDTFVRTPHQLINYGAAIDKDAKCVKVYDEDLKKGYPVNGADDDRPRKNMGKCNKAYVAAADNPMNGLIGLTMIYPSGGLLVLFFIILAAVLGVLTALAMFEATRAAWVMLKAIIPGSGTGEIWESICIVGVVLAYIVVTLMSVGAFLLLLEALMTAEGVDVRMMFILVDCVVLVASIMLLLQLARARKAGKKLGQNITSKVMPQAKAVDVNKASPMRVISATAGMASPAIGMMAHRRMNNGAPGQTAPTAATTAAATAAGGPTPPRKTGLVKGTTKLAWGATKLGLASTVGAPVYAPRAAGAVKAGMSAKRTQLGQKFSQAKANTAQRVDAKRTQATDFGREYAHNVGAAGKFVAKYSGAARVAGAAMSAGVDPVTSTAAGAVVHLARGPRAGQFRERPSQTQHRPAVTRPPQDGPAGRPSVRPSVPAPAPASGPSATVPQVRPASPVRSATTVPTVQAPPVSRARQEQAAAVDQLVERMRARQAARGAREEDIPRITVASLNR